MQVSSRNKILANARRRNQILAPEELFWRPFFKAKTRLYWSNSGGEVVGNGSNYFFVSYWWMYFVWSFKNAPRVPKLGYFDRRVPKLGSRWHAKCLRVPVWSYTYNIITTSLKGRESTTILMQVYGGGNI